MHEFKYTFKQVKPDEKLHMIFTSKERVENEELLIDELMKRFNLQNNDKTVFWLIVESTGFLRHKRIITYIR